MSISNEDIEELKKAILDPASMQAASMNRLEKALNGEFDIVDPNNPMAFLMENTSVLTATMMQGIETNMRQMYPVLANDKSDLYNHINDSEINDIIATPSEAIFSIFLLLTDIVEYGKEDAYGYSVKIPKYSFITVNGLTFTLLNDVSVKYFANGSVYAEILYDDLDLAINVNKTVESSIVTNADGVKHVLLSLPIKQVKRYEVRETLLYKQPFIKDVIVEDSFTFLKATSVSTALKREIELEKTFSEFVYNPNKPSILIKPLETALRLEVPSVYLINNDITSYVDLEIYTTRGDIVVPLSTYSADEFEMTYNMSAAEIDNNINSISTFILATTYTYGGRAEVTFEELKEKVVQYSTGDNKLPITIDEIKDNVKKNGYEFMFVTDTVTKREFAIAKYLNNLGYNVLSNVDLFMGELVLDLTKVYSSKIVNVDDSIIINPFQRFNLKDGKLIPLTDSEEETLLNNSKVDLTSYNKDIVLLNPYLYILDYKKSLSTRIYDINQPTINDVKTIFNNGPVSPVEFEDRVIKRKKFGFEFYFYLTDDNNLDKVLLDKTLAQLDITVSNVTRLSYKGEVILDEYIGVYIYFDIDLEGHISEDDKMLFINADSDVNSAYVDIESDMTLYIYSTDEDVSGVETYDVASIVDEDAKAILYIEEFTTSLAMNLDSIYRNYNVKFSDRKFKTYEEDVYLTYKTDIYEIDEDGTVLLKYDESTGEDELVIKYNAGDTVLDENDEPVILHRAGDIMLDENDEPIIDFVGGLEHIIDLMLFEDGFTKSTNTDYIDYTLTYLQQLTSVVTDEIPLLEEGLIENTKFKLTALNTIKPVSILIGGEWVTYSNFIYPTITINVLRGEEILVDDVLEAKITMVLQELLSTNVVLNTIEEVLKNIIGENVISVRISDIVDTEISSIEYKEDSGRFILTKELTKNINGESIVKSKIKINVIAI